MLMSKCEPGRPITAAYTIIMSRTLKVTSYHVMYYRVHEGKEKFGLVHDKDTICSAFVLNLSLQMSSLTHLSVFRPGQIMIFNSDLHHICLHLHSEANAQLSYLSSGQMSYLSSSQIPTNATNIIFEPHLECICLTSNLFFRPVLRA